MSHCGALAPALPVIPHDAAQDHRRPAVIALVGNPNTGKSALFNALTGYHRHVANYPGVTVDVGRGPIRGARRPLELLDLPGTYSLKPNSPDERVLAGVLRGTGTDCGKTRAGCGDDPSGPGTGDLDGRPAAVLVVIDASNPVRNLYLVSQVVELGLPVVVALNMVDIAEARGIYIDAAKLAARLGAPVVPVVATRPDTVTPLVGAVERALSGGPPRVPEFPNDGGPAEVRARYAWVDQVLSGVIERRLAPGKTWTTRLDRVLTHRVVGLLVLVGVLYGLFVAIYAGARPVMNLMESAFAWLSAQAGAHLPEGVVRSLVADGLIAGVGGVLTFLPQILILFLFIAILEDFGYFARAAFMVDRLMRPLGLSGRAFIPLLSSFACAVPAIMGTRAIADRRERFITILIAPFMSCSARLPIYVLMTSAFVPATSLGATRWLGGWLRVDALVMLGIYLLGVVVAMAVALLLRKTAFAGPASAFLLELPTYKLPRLRTLWQRVYLAGRSFVVRAGTVILLVNLVVWALGYFPRSAATRTRVEREWTQQTSPAVPSANQPLRSNLAADPQFQAQLAGQYLHDSLLGHLGRAIEPAIRPLGWDWRIGVSVLASFPAREVVIATLGTVANLGTGDDADVSALRDGLRAMRREDGRPLFTLPVALSIMVFFALCMQCTSTLVVMARETGTWRWPAASFLFMTGLAYLAAWGVAAGARAAGL